MAKRIVGFILLMLALSAPQAQAQGRGAERIHAIKVGYLTDRLQLTSQQAAAFWPVYDNYEAELRSTRRAFRAQNRQAITNDEEANQMIDDRMELQEDVLAINRKYKDQFLKVITPQQLVALYEAERDFKKLLLQQLRNKRRR